MKLVLEGAQNKECSEKDKTKFFITRVFVYNMFCVFVWLDICLKSRDIFFLNFQKDVNTHTPLITSVIFCDIFRQFLSTPHTPEYEVK